MLMRFLTAMWIAGQLFLASVTADELDIIVTKQSPIDKLSLKQVENIFRRKTLISPQGTKWNPINLSANHPLRQAFAEKVFQEPPEAMEEYWNTQYFQGIMPPYVVNSEEAMLRFVENTPGAIGYLLPCQVDERVKVILKLPVNESLMQFCKKN